MVFSSMLFVFLFLPANLLSQLLLKSPKAKNIAMVTFSLIFYSWAGPRYLFLLLGMVMDTGPAIIILAPVLLPAVQELGIDAVHFGVVLVCCLSIGLATPPFGLDLFVAGNLSEEPPMAVAKRALPFMIAFLLALLLITYIPWFSTVLLG